MSEVNELKDFNELEQNAVVEQSATADFNPELNPDHIIKHWYENPKYNDGIHYSTEKALSQDWDYCLTNGGRNNGKTTGWQMQMFDDFFNYGYVYGKIVRKYIFDVIKQKSWFSDFALDYLKEEWGCELIVYKWDYYVAPIEGSPNRTLPKEKGQRVGRINKQLICKTFNLAYENDDKSHDYNFIKRLIFEEYSLINNFEYIADEVEHFNSLISTINREREDLKVIFIGNTISKHNPYFDWLNINVNKLKLKAGENILLQCNAYEDGAKIYVEIVPTVYGGKIKCPRILKVGNNEIAVTGDWVISENVFNVDYDDFIAGLDKSFNLAFKNHNKLYYHFTCHYKNTTFNVITNRIKGIKSSGLIYECNINTIDRIKNGTLLKSTLYKLLDENIKYETIFSDDEIEYEYNKLLKRTIK